MMFRSESAARAPVPPPKETAEARMRRTIMECRKAGKAFVLENYSAVKLFYGVCRALALSGKTRKRADGNGWDCWSE